MKNKLWIIVFLFISACGNHSPGYTPPVNKKVITTGHTETLPGTEGDEALPAMKIVDWDLDLETDHIQPAREHISRLIKQYGAIITMENESSYGSRHQIDWEIRVPSDKADRFVDEIRQSKEWRVISSHLNVRDITDSYMDAEARLRNLRKLEERYTQMLQKAANMSDMISIEKELNRIRTEIERLQGRLARMKHQVDYTRVHILLHQNIRSMPSFFHRMKTALTDGWRLFQELVLLLARLWLVGLVAVLLVWWWRWRKRRKALKQGPPDPSGSDSGVA